MKTHKKVAQIDNWSNN